jgi:NTE family protein
MNSEARIHDVLEHYFGTELSADELSAFDHQKIQGGQWLFHQGDPGDALYLLARGRLQAWRENGEGETPRLLGEIVPGDSVGEMGLLSGQARSAGVKAVRDSLLVHIGREQFNALARKHPALVTRLAINVVGMTQRAARGTARYRPPRTIAVVPLDSRAAASDLITRLVAELGDRGDAVLLMPNHCPATDGETEALRDWLYEQEDAHDLVLFGHEEGNDRWNELARRQADLLLFIADGRSAPGNHVHTVAQTDYGAQHALVLLQPGSDTAISGTGKWLDACPVDFHLHVRDGEPDDLARLARVLSGQAVGLVLSAGAARGFAHIGVYRAMRELGIPVDWIGGSSIGSIMGAAMAAGWDLERIEQTARRCFVQGKPFSDYTVPVTSLIRGRRMTKLLKEHLDFSIEDLPIPFFCVSSVLDDGSLNRHQRGSLASALCASAALPGVIPPAVVNRRLAIDGSVLNSLPVDLMQNMPVGCIVAVDLSSQKSYEVEYDEVPSAWRVLAGRYLPFIKRQRVPPLSTIMLKATEIGTLGRMRELGRNADLLLQPDVRGFGITEVRTFDRIVEAGYHCARETLKDWRPNSAA